MGLLLSIARRQPEQAGNRSKAPENFVHLVAQESKPMHFVPQHKVPALQKTRLASSQWTRAWWHAFPFLFTTRTIWSSDPQKVPWENQWKKTKWGFEITELRSSNGKTTGNRFDFEIAGLLRLNLVRNIEGPLCSEIPCLIARCLGTWSRFCAYRMTVTVPVSVRYSLTQTLQGEQYQFIEATNYPPLLLPESHRNWKFRNAESSQGHSRSHAVLRSHADWAKSLRLSV